MLGTRSGRHRFVKPLIAPIPPQQLNVRPADGERLSYLLS